MKILVTGAAGFIGSYLIEKLSQQGFEIIASDIAPEPQWGNINNESMLSYKRIDFSIESDIYKLIGTERPTHIIHLVSLLAGPCENDPRLGFRVNFQSTLALLDACVAFNVKRFLMTSSISVFGKGIPEPVFDDSVKLPANVYGQTKLFCENMLEWYHNKHKLSVGAVRYPWVFGPGRKTGITAEYSSKLIDSIAKNEKIVIHNPEEKGDWLYVKDAVKSLLLLLNPPKQSRITYNIMGKLSSIREALTIAKNIKPSANIEYLNNNLSQSPYPVEYDDSNARIDLGWKPDYSLESAIKDHISIVSKKNNL